MELAASGPLFMSITNAVNTMNALPPSIALKTVMDSFMVSNS